MLNVTWWFVDHANFNVSTYGPDNSLKLTRICKTDADVREMKRNKLLQLNCFRKFENCFMNVWIVMVLKMFVVLKFNNAFKSFIFSA